MPNINPVYRELGPWLAILADTGGCSRTPHLVHRKLHENITRKIIMPVGQPNEIFVPVGTFDVEGTFGGEATTYVTGVTHVIQEMRYQWLKPVHPPVLVVKRYAWTGSRERHLKAAYVKMDPESGSSGRSGRSSPGDRRTEFDDVTWSGRSSHAFSSGSRRSGAKQEPSFDRYASSTQRTPAGHSSSFRESPSPEDQGSSDRQPSGASAGTAFGWFSRYLLQSTEDAGLIDSTQFDRARSDGIMTEDTTFTWLKTSPVIEGVTEYAGLSIRLPGAKEVQLWQTKVTATDDNVLPPRLAIVLLYKVDRNGQRDRFPTARITVRPGSELAKGIGRQTAQGIPQRAATPSTRSGTSRRTTSGGSRGFDADFSFGDTLPRARTWADEESSRDQDRYGKSYHHESFNEWL